MSFIPIGHGVYVDQAIVCCQVVWVDEPHGSIFVVQCVSSKSAFADVASTKHGDTRRMRRSVPCVCRSSLFVCKLYQYNRKQIPLISALYATTEDSRRTALHVIRREFRSSPEFLLADSHISVFSRTTGISVYLLFICLIWLVLHLTIMYG